MVSVDNECDGALGGWVNVDLGRAASFSGSLKVAMDSAFWNAVPFGCFSNRYTPIGIGDTGNGGGESEGSEFIFAQGRTRRSR